MFWRTGPSISDDLKGWIHDSFDWADEAFGTTWRDSRTLITATRDYFTAGAGNTPAIAQQIADDIARLLPVAPVPVQPLSQVSAEYRHSYQKLSSVAGT